MLLDFARLIYHNQFYFFSSPILFISQSLHCSNWKHHLPSCLGRWLFHILDFVFLWSFLGVHTQANFDGSTVECFQNVTACSSHARPSHHRPSLNPSRVYFLFSPFSHSQNQLCHPRRTHGSTQPHLQQKPFLSCPQNSWKPSMCFWIEVKSSSIVTS